MRPIYDEDGNLIGYEDAKDVTSEDDSWFWQSIGIDPKTISYTETSPTNEEIEKTLGISSSPLDFPPKTALIKSKGDDEIPKDFSIS